MPKKPGTVLARTETAYFFSYEDEYADLLRQAAEWIEKRSGEHHNDVVILSLGFYRDSEQDHTGLTMTVELS